MPVTSATPRFSGAKLLDLRARRKMSRQALAVAVRPNLSATTIVRWERDQNAPSANDLLAIATVLGVDVNELVAVA